MVRICGFLLLLICFETLLMPVQAQPLPTMDYYATTSQGAIPYWLMLGFIPMRAQKQLVPRDSAEAVDYPYLPDEGKIAPVADEQATIDGITYTWRPVTGVEPPALLTNFLLGGSEQCVMYLVTYVNIAREVPTAYLSWGSDDSAAVSINGERVGIYRGWRGCVPDQDITAGFPLRKGINTIMVKLGNDKYGWGFIARLVDADGHPLADLPMVAAPAGKHAGAKTWNYVTDTDDIRKRPAATFTRIELDAETFLADGAKRARFVSDVSCVLNQVVIRDAHTDHEVYAIPKRGGAIGIPEGSLDQAKSQFPITAVYLCNRLLNFTDFTTPGSYYLYSEQYRTKSSAFTINKPTDPGK